MTGAGDHLALLWAIFHDGVQMYDKTQATTMVFSTKCLCLPSWLVQTLAASYNIAFVGVRHSNKSLEFMRLSLEHLNFFDFPGLSTWTWPYGVT
jgi:hypothetical protein